MTPSFIELKGIGGVVIEPFYMTLHHVWGSKMKTPFTRHFPHIACIPRIQVTHNRKDVELLIE